MYRSSHKKVFDIFQGAISLTGNIFFLNKSLSCFNAYIIIFTLLLKCLINLKLKA